MAVKVIARNRKAAHDYFLGNRYEAGLVLTGSEIKSIRAGRVSLREGYVQEREGELWLVGCHIAVYEEAGRFGHSDPLRPRKLLLHRREIRHISSELRERGVAAVPTTLYLDHGLAKLEIALARGKRQYDKRRTIAKRDSQRQIERALNQRG
ncbi:MAG: SsrA-binding protein SmpB [Anaerolineaceae bacterium]|nr:SsrA-binding protein SmpB [Anaerolineaceae bacterium]MCY4022953.1 SsrA-binding protein SmpB [Anaerolineaceae bacterium]